MLYKVIFGLFMEIVKQNLKIIVPVGVVLIVVIILSGVFLFNKFSQKTETDPQAQADQEVKKYVSEVGKLMDLPVNETPTVATIIDISKLAGQPFFARGKNGDKVLIYSNNQKAILYDPEAKKIIEVGPFNPNPATGSATTSTSVVLRNGTKVTDLASKIEEKIKALIPGIAVSKEEALKNNYTKTVITLLNPARKAEAESIAKDLKAQISELASGEATPANADIVVIIGSDLLL